MEFDTGAWLSDERLGMCAEETRGIWMDWLAAMHKDGQSGELRGTYEQLAKLGRTTPKKAETAVADLKRTGAAEVVTRRSMEGVPVHVTLKNRRMQRAAAARKLNREKKFQQRHREGALNVPRMSPLNASETSKSAYYSGSEDPDSEKRRTRKRATRPPIPAELLAVDGFRSLWNERILSLPASRRPTPLGEEIQLREAMAVLADHGATALIGAVEEAINRKWTGFKREWAERQQSPARGRDGRPEAKYPYRKLGE